VTDYLAVGHIATSVLLRELDKRAEKEPGAFTPAQVEQLKALVHKLAPKPESMR
jgi:hypothetical protein